MLCVLQNPFRLAWASTLCPDPQDRWVEHKEPPSLNHDVRPATCIIRDLFFSQRKNGSIMVGRIFTPVRCCGKWAPNTQSFLGRAFAAEMAEATQSWLGMTVKGSWGKTTQRGASRHRILRLAPEKSKNRILASHLVPKQSKQNHSVGNQSNWFTEPWTEIWEKSSRQDKAGCCVGMTMGYETTEGGANKSQEIIARKRIRNGGRSQRYRILQHDIETGTNIKLCS